MTIASTADESNPMLRKRFLVIGATGQVGSKIATRLADRGHDVTALVRQFGARILDPYMVQIRYVVGDLSDEASMRGALNGSDVVVSTANGIVPKKAGDNASNVNENADRGASAKRRLTGIDGLRGAPSHQPASEARRLFASCASRPDQRARDRGTNGRSSRLDGSCCGGLEK